MVSVPIGERIAVYRRRRGLSQAALAALIGRSESWLSQVERGKRSADRLSVLVEMAKILHVDVEALTGSVRHQIVPDAAMPADLSAVRSHFARNDRLLPRDAEPVLAAATLRIEAAKLHENYQAAKYGQAVALLPGLLANADAVWPVRSRADVKNALSGYFASYLVAAKLLTKMGADDLAIIAADRCATAAASFDCDQARALAVYQVVCASLRAGRREDAEELASTAAESFRAATPALASAVGSLWLIASVIAARRLDRTEASRRLTAAEAIADQVGEDANFGWTAFGPDECRDPPRQRSRGAR